MQLRRASGLAASLALLLGAGTAAASNALESPDNGAQQTGRGGAWFVRADDPLAAYYNPAAMAFQASGVHLGAALMFEARCYTRQGVDGLAVSPKGGIPGPGAVRATDDTKSIAPPAATCGTGTGLFPNPNLAAVFRLSDRLAIGLAVVGPHADGKNEWPEELPYTNRFGVAGTQPAPNRYMLVKSDALLLFPTLSVAYAPTDTLSFGVGLTWGIASASFTNFAEAIRNDNHSSPDDFTHDIHAELKAKDMFVPGFTVSALWMPSKNLDISALFKWQDSFKTETADVTLQANYWTTTGARSEAKDVIETQAIDKGTLKLNLPMEAKLGLRFHQDRKEATEQPSWITKHPTRRVRDPLSQEVFDVEVDFTWANDSAIDQLYLTFQPGILVNLGGGVTSPLPTNANIPHNFKDVVGVRVGADFNVIPSRLALRAGFFYETKGQRDEYLGLDFDNAQKVGIGGGATLRLGPVDVSASFQHTGYGTLDNKGVGAVHALSGDAKSCENGVTTGLCNRSVQAINGGILEQSLNEVGLGGTVRF